jgi:glyoxylate reductase
MSAHSPRILVTHELPGDAVARLRAARPDLDIDLNEESRALEPDELRERSRGCAAIITMPRDRVDATVLDAAGPQLRIVSNFAVGVDNIDVEEARRRGIRVGHTPNATTEPTADVAWLLLLAAARRAAEGIDLVRSDTWTGVAPTQLLGVRIVGMTLLIVGAGRIGYATARRSIGWEMNVLYHARSEHPEFEAPPITARRVELDEGLAEADFVSLHTPLTDETRHLIDARRLALMKPTAVLVNTARGPVVDEAALARALHERRIFAAGLDVLEREPVVHADLAEAPNVFILPHLGSATTQDRTWMMEMAVDNVLAVLADEEPAHAVA